MLKNGQGSALGEAYIHLAVPSKCLDGLRKCLKF